MADATMEGSLAAAIESSVADAGTLVWLVPPLYHHHHHGRFHQEHLDDPATQRQLVLPPDDDVDEEEGGLVIVAGDVVAGLLDELSPRESDLDERILECPMFHRVLLLAMATLPHPAEAAVADVISQQLEGEAYRNGGKRSTPAPETTTARQIITGAVAVDFEDGEEVSVMPCSGGHGFHTDCIVEWLGQYSNMCPLCRYALPTAADA
ncbi:hypothetical protein HU200_030828 [Digitaria exilis]|uniref:RING-type domain-containing protein n=1 Tax=Digitaria exilis TaxID=1010633 RepID=A0A835BRD6_9POAL|nr:hypothetical protein HU200_030828 [Digitaria exilis]